MGDDDVYDLRWFLVLKGLIPTSLLLQLEAGRNFETFIASTSGLKPFSSTYSYQGQRRQESFGSG